MTLSDSYNASGFWYTKEIIKTWFTIYTKLIYIYRSFRVIKFSLGVFKVILPFTILVQLKFIAKVSQNDKIISGKRYKVRTFGPKLIFSRFVFGLPSFAEFLVTLASYSQLKNVFLKFLPSEIWIFLNSKQDTEIFFDIPQKVLCS